MTINYEDVIGVAQQLIEIEPNFEEKFEDFETSLKLHYQMLLTDPRSVRMIAWHEDQRELYPYEFSDAAGFLNDVCNCLRDDGFKAILLDKDCVIGSISYFPWD